MTLLRPSIRSSKYRARINRTLSIRFFFSTRWFCLPHSFFTDWVVFDLFFRMLVVPELEARKYHRSEAHSNKKVRNNCTLVSFTGHKVLYWTTGFWCTFDWASKLELHCLSGDETMFRFLRTILAGSPFLIQFWFVCSFTEIEQESTLIVLHETSPVKQTTCLRNYFQIIETSLGLTARKRCYRSSTVVWVALILFSWLCFMRRSPLKEEKPKQDIR